MIRKKDKIHTHKSAIGILILIVVIVLAVAGVSAKYIQSKKNTDDTVAADFYFTSTLLSEEGATYTLMPTTTELEIPVCNYADDLRYSSKEIQYSYIVTKDGQEVSNGNGNIESGDLKSSNIQLTDLSAGTYTVTATTESPFKTTLTGTFIIPKESEDMYYSVTDQDGSPYVLVTVWTENYNGKAKLTWPENVIPDSTDPQLKSANTYSTSGGYAAGAMTISCGAYSSDTFRFFKEDLSEVYTENQFTALKTER